MEYLGIETKKYCTDELINNIPSNFSKIVGVESDLQLNENERFVGKILLIDDSPNFSLGQYIEFLEKNIKYRFSKFDDEGNGFYLVNRYWCRKYSPILKLKVPVDVWRPKESKFEKEIKIYTYEQFFKYKMTHFCRDWPHIFVAAVENCNKLFSKGKWYSINSTVKFYHVDQKQLQSYWGKWNKQISVVCRQWDKLFRYNFENDYAFAQQQKRRNKIKLEQENNVIQLRN